MRPASGRLFGARVTGLARGPEGVRRLVLCLVVALASCGEDPGPLPGHTPPEQLAFFEGLEGVRTEVEEARKEADRTLGKAGNLVLTFDSMSGKGPARRARQIAQEHRKKIEEPARLRAAAFLREVEGLAIRGWYGRVERINSRTKSEMAEPACEIAFGRIGSPDLAMAPQLRFRCVATGPIEGFADLEERDWVHFSGTALGARSDSLSRDLNHPSVAVRLTALEAAPPPNEAPRGGER